MRIRTHLQKLLVAVASAGVLMSCGGREVPPRYYVATSTLERKAETVAPGSVRKVVYSAGNLLKGGKATVAFLPPSWCDDHNKEDNGHSIQEKHACLALTSAMERQASEQGYRVVDWRRLKNDATPHLTAQKENLDALFVIDELVIHKPGMDRFQVTELDFAEQTSATERAPIAPNNLNTVTARCKGAHRARQRRKLDQSTVSGVSLSLKMVSVENGTAQWFYSHNVSSDSASMTQKSDYYYLSEGKKEIKGSRLAIGLVLSAIGTSGLIAGTRINEDGTSFATRNIGFGLAWASVLPLTIGAVMTTAGLVSVAKRPIYQSPEKVICARPPFKDNPLATEAPPPRIPPKNRSKRNRRNQHGPPEEAHRTVLSAHSPLIDELTDHLFDAVQTLSLDRTAPVSPPKVATVPTPLQDNSPTAPTPADNDSQLIITERTKTNVGDDQASKTREGAGNE